MYDDGRWTCGVVESSGGSSVAGFGFVVGCCSLVGGAARTKGMKCSFAPTMGKEVILKT